MSSVVVIGDVHGNARALRAALDRADQYRPDLLVFLGDLLTYGHDVREVLDVVAARVQSGAHLLLGNHDKMYLDILDGDSSYFDRLPDWIKHSVEKTLDLLDARDLRALAWVDEVAFEDILISHANPFGHGDWTYLNAHEEQERAAETVARRNVRAAVFGHTHRARWYTGDARSATEDVPLSSPLAIPDGRTLIANAGAVGQPRDTRRRSLILNLSIDGARLEGTFEPIDYDVDAHLRDLRASGLPATTIEKLCSFFVAT